MNEAKQSGERQARAVRTNYWKAGTKRARCTVSWAVVCAAALTAGEPDLARRFFEQDDFDTVCARAKEAFAQDSGAAETAMAYARTLTNAGQARVYYKKIAVRKASPDSLRAEAYYRLACIAFMAGNYAKAASYCGYGRGFGVNPIYAHLSDRSVVRVQADSAVAIPEKTTLMAFPNRGTDTARKTEKTPDSALSRGRYYVQVGAFSAVDNAEGLKNELGRYFSKVSITAGNSGGKQVFRVRVGGFTSKEAAQAFGDSALTKRGTPFRIVEE